MSRPGTRFVLFASPLALLAAGAGGLNACGAEFTLECPEGTTQTAGGGDVGEACTDNRLLGGSGGVAGEGGAPSAGSGGMAPVPPGGVCSPNATKCEGDAQQTCGADGQWGAAAPCDIECDTAGGKCVVPEEVGVAEATACARLSNGTVRCWGANDFGLLGNGTDAGALKPTPVLGVSSAKKLVVGPRGACVVNNDGTATCWGKNDVGQFVDNGGGEQNLVKVPVLMGLTDVRDVSVGFNNTCAVVGTSGASTVVCRGDNTKGQLGNGTYVASAKFETVKGLPADIRTVSAGSHEACAVQEPQGATFCWGAGKGTGDFTGEPSAEASPLGGNASVGVRQLSMGAIGAFAVRDDGALVLWGGYNPATGVPQNQIFVPRNVPLGAKVTQVSVKFSHACALDSDGSVWCWGYNGDAQVGAPCKSLGSCEGETVINPIKTNAEPSSQVAVGDRSTCVLTKTHKIVCWGGNPSGQLGAGYASQREPPTKVIWR
jgi:alpha-tubulin suppressor-like RCC1 family protein